MEVELAWGLPRASRQAGDKPGVENVQRTRADAFSCRCSLDIRDGHPAPKSRSNSSYARFSRLDATYSANPVYRSHSSKQGLLNKSRLAKIPSLIPRIDGRAVSQSIIPAVIRFKTSRGADRPFVERRLPSLAGRLWACSMAEIDRMELGFDGKALGHLVSQCGWFFEGHRAENDVLALIYLLPCRS